MTEAKFQDFALMLKQEWNIGIAVFNGMALFNNKGTIIFLIGV